MLCQHITRSHCLIVGNKCMFEIGECEARKRGQTLKMAKKCDAGLGRPQLGWNSYKKCDIPAYVTVKIIHYPFYSGITRPTGLPNPSSTINVIIENLTWFWSFGLHQAPMSYSHELIPVLCLRWSWFVGQWYTSQRRQIWGETSCTGWRILYREIWKVPQRRASQRCISFCKYVDERFLTYD